ncbi:heat shock 70 kDa protein 12B-like [Saccostrea echinata]|uniref:heat shock 70 kDa protein 12B-like n=1 Tax=Saccostrea echinata TaxID=191078 RepID=UPI002A83084C|nr:heat shock 70 kDa protein 12B-like [Saccostrea echinata]
MATEDTDVTPWPVVCAIDFGTTYSGYAYSMRTDYERDPLNIESNPPWFNEGQGTLKTPTCILFDKSENFHSFGYDAERTYTSLAEKAQERKENDEDEDSDDDDDEDDDSNDEKRKVKPKEDVFHEWLFFRRFKMKLFHDASERRKRLKNLKLEAENGRKLSALKVFSEAIRFLKSHFEDLLEKTTLRHDEKTRTPTNATDDSADDSQSSQNSEDVWEPSIYPEQEDKSLKNMSTDIKVKHSTWSADILWVLTVPAIWSDEAKQFMREAAIQAGIQDDHLVLALEPESAALLCKQLALTKAAEDINVRMFDPGNKFMVVDCGGGTVDVTAYEVKENSNLRELHCASGDAVGGTNVDKLFFDLIYKIFGEETVNNFKSKSPSDWLELLRSFEAKKRGIGLENPKLENVGSVTFSNLGELFSEFTNTGKSVSSQIHTLGLKKKIKPFSKAKLRFDESFLAETVFNRPIEDVISHLQNLFTDKDVSEINVILLVGGFSECPLLQSKIKSHFPHKKVINPREGCTAVMKGAVLFGHSPENLIRKSIEQGFQLPPIIGNQGILRKSKAYYGVATDLPFIEDVHPRNHKYTREDGQEVCSDCFDCMVEENQELEIGKTVIKKTFGSSSSSSAYVEIYQSKSKVLYCTDEDCKKIGQIFALFSKTDDSTEKRLIEVQLHFGFTENIATALDLMTNRSWKVKLDCLT